MRAEFRLNDKHLQKLIDASKPVPYMIIGGISPKSQQENVNDAWAELGQELGFDWLTVCSVSGKDQRCFTAELL